MSEFHYNASDDRVAATAGVLYDMVRGYLEAAMFTEHDNDSNSIDADDQFSPDAVVRATSDCAKFLHMTLDQVNVADRKLGASQFGRDLWLTRNRHGVGFWDRDLGEVGEKLTEAANAMGEAYMYKNDSDGLLYLE